MESYINCYSVFNISDFISLVKRSCFSAGEPRIVDACTFSARQNVHDNPLSCDFEDGDCGSFTSSEWNITSTTDGRGMARNNSLKHDLQQYTFLRLVIVV